MQNTAIVFPGEAWQEATPESQGIDSARLGKALAKLREISLEQGTDQTVVVRNGYVVWHGPDIDNKHTIWSCGKSFLSIAFGLLVDDGKCSIDSLAAGFLPSLKEHYPTVTLRQFANFTCGYRPREGGDTTAVFDPAAPVFEPGTRFQYSQASDQLANVLTRVAGEPLRDVFRRRIAEPIGMNPAAWSWGDWGVVDGLAVCGGSGSYERGISITARELARVGWLLACRGRWNGRQLLSEAYIGEMTRPQVAATVPPHDADGWYVRLPGSYGLNLWLNGVTPDGKRMWPDAPPGTVAIQGNNNNFCFAVPEWRMVLVRMGTDGRINNNRYTEVFALLREALLEEP